MSHFGRFGPPDIKNTYSLLILNITFRTSADDLFPLFDRYGKVVDVFIPRDRRTGESRGFAFVRYKHEDEARRAMERLDGVNVNGRNIVVQLAKYGRSMERIDQGRMAFGSEWSSRADSRIPRRLGGSNSGGKHYENDYGDRDVSRGNSDYGRFDRYRSRGSGPDSQRSVHGRSRSPSHGHGREYRRRRSRSRSLDRNTSQLVSRRPASRHLSSQDHAISRGSLSPRHVSPHVRDISRGSLSPKHVSPTVRDISRESPLPRHLSPHDRVPLRRSPSPRRPSSFDRPVSRRAPSPRRSSSFDGPVSRRSPSPRRSSSLDRPVSRRSPSPRRSSSFDHPASRSPSPRRSSSFDRPVSRKSPSPRRLSSFDRPVSRKSPSPRRSSSYDHAVSSDSPTHMSSHDPSMSPYSSRNQKQQLSPVQHIAAGPDDLSVSPARDYRPRQESRSRSISPANKENSSPDNEYLD